MHEVENIRQVMQVKQNFLSYLLFMYEIIHTYTSSFIHSFLYIIHSLFIRQITNCVIHYYTIRHSFSHCSPPSLSYPYFHPLIHLINPEMTDSPPPPQVTGDSLLSGEACNCYHCGQLLHHTTNRLLSLPPGWSVRICHGGPGLKTIPKETVSPLFNRLFRFQGQSSVVANGSNDWNAPANQKQSRNDSNTSANQR